jgi:hypothetical protein
MRDARVARRIRVPCTDMEKLRNTKRRALRARESSRISMRSRRGASTRWPRGVPVRDQNSNAMDQAAHKPSARNEGHAITAGVSENLPSRIFAKWRGSGIRAVVECRAFVLSLAADSPRTFASPPTIREPARSRLENSRPNSRMSTASRIRERRWRPADRRKPPAIPRLSRPCGTAGSDVAGVGD